MCGLLYVHLVYIEDEGGGCEIQKRCCTSVAVIKDQHQHRVMTKKTLINRDFNAIKSFTFTDQTDVPDILYFSSSPFTVNLISHSHHC